MLSFGISTWSLHRSLQSGSIDLLDVPAQVREHGMTQLHVCHFHLPSREEAFLKLFRHRIESQGVMLDTMLLDFGDLSHPEQAAKDVVEYEGWLETAAQLGAKHARIAAGTQAPTAETLAHSAKHLLHLAEVGERLGVRVITENWHAMMPGSAQVLHLRQLTDRRVPLCFDTGNWAGPEKYDELEKIAPHAVTVHAKCEYSPDNTPDVADFERSLTILKRSNFSGAIALIYSGPSAEEWRYLDEELVLARGVFTND